MKDLGDAVRQETAHYAKEIRIPIPLLATTIKPEGTLSQLAGGISQGIHLSHSPYFIRRIRINSHDPMAQVIKHTNWTINPEVGTLGATYEEKMKNARTWVIDFPVASSVKKTKYQTTVEEQLETYFTYQRTYTDHNCSNTISVRAPEWEKLPQLIYDHWDQYLGITFISLDENNYELAPYEECSEETYRHMKTTMDGFDFKLLEQYDRELYAPDPIDSKQDSMAIMLDETHKSECAGGVCPLR
jgi:ribonucleoside-diphosphate reductase alpha chain/ribonucleoside-triphosphate reductase